MLPWAKFVFPEAAFCNKIGSCFHLQEIFREASSSLPRHLPSQCCFPISATSPTTWSSSESSTSPTTLPTTASCTGEHLLLYFPGLWENRGAKRGPAICTCSSQQAPDQLVKKAFFCTGGTCWYSPLSGTSSCPPRIRCVLGAQGGLGFVWAPQQGSTHGMASAVAPKAARISWGFAPSSTLMPLGS